MCGVRPVSSGIYLWFGTRVRFSSKLSAVDALHVLGRSESCWRIIRVSSMSLVAYSRGSSSSVANQRVNQTFSDPVGGASDGISSVNTGHSFVFVCDGFWMTYICANLTSCLFKYLHNRIFVMCNLYILHLCIWQTMFDLVHFIFLISMCVLGLNPSPLLS